MTIARYSPLEAVFAAYLVSVPPSSAPSGSRSRQEGMLRSRVHTTAAMTATNAASIMNDILRDMLSTIQVIIGDATKALTPVAAMHIPIARP